MEREPPYSPKHCPVVEQEVPSVFKEQFVPPDLSIWDYLIAKVIKNQNNVQFSLSFNAASSELRTRNQSV